MLEKVEMNQQIESEKQEIDKLLVEIREAKETLIKFNEDLEKAIAAECHIEAALKAAAGSCDNIVSGICNAIVKAERDTNFKATITSEQLAEIKLGQQVKVYADYGKDVRQEYPGVVTWISDTSEFTPKTILTKDERANLVYAVKIAVKNDGMLKIGMYGGCNFN